MGEDVARDGDVPPVLPRADGARADADDVRELLGELRDLRLGLAADLGLVASAVELDAPDIAAQVVDGRRADLAELSERLLSRTGPGRLRRPGRLGPAAPALAAAAALVTVLLGLLPVLDGADPDRARTPAAVTTDAPADRPSAPAATSTATAGSAHARSLELEIVRIVRTAPADPLWAQDALGRVAAQIPTVGDPQQRDDLTALLRAAQRQVAALQEQGAGRVAPPPALPPAPALGPAVPSPGPAAGVPAVPAAPPPASPSPGPGGTPAPAPDPATPATTQNGGPPLPGLTPGGGPALPGGGPASP